MRATQKRRNATGTDNSSCIFAKTLKTVCLYVLNRILLLTFRCPFLMRQLVFFSPNKSLRIHLTYFCYRTTINENRENYLLLCSSADGYSDRGYEFGAGPNFHVPQLMFMLILCLFIFYFLI